MTKEDVIEILERFVIGAKPCSQREIVDVCASAYRMLKEQPSLPSSLDEAAEKYAKGEGLENALGGWEDMSDAFKAGAEWMAGQGVTLEGRVCKDDYAAEAPFYYVETENSDDLPLVGDKVIVQVRKKQKKEIEKSKEYFPLDIFNNDELNHCKELSKDGPFHVVKYIKSVHPELGLKEAKIYYDLYFSE